MARIVPSQVVSYIDEALPKDNWKVLGPAQVGAVAGLLKLIEQVSGELLVIDSQQRLTPPPRLWTGSKMESGNTPSLSCTVRKPKPSR